jgi:hypothetical protein
MVIEIIFVLWSYCREEGIHISLPNSIIESPATFASKMSPATYYLQMSPGRAEFRHGVSWRHFALHAHLCKKRIWF